MKRFVYVCADAGIPLPGSKGSSVHVAGVCRALSRRGLTGEIHTMRAKAPELDGHPLRALQVEPESDDGSSGGRELSLYLAGRHCPQLVNPECDFVYERYSLWHTGGLALARHLGVPFILEVNSPLPDEASRYRKLHHEQLADGVAELLLANADGVVCVSERVTEWATGLRGNATNVWTVPNGVDRELFSRTVEPVTESEWHAPGPVIAFAGSFRPWHGMDCLLDAFNELIRDHLSNAQLLCVGDGPERAPFERRARSLGLMDRIHITGMLPQADVARWLARADVAVAPYPDIDRFYFSPLKIYEFMALGLPVIGSDIGQVREILADGRGGWLHEPGNAGELAQTLARVLSDPKEATRRGDAGCQWVHAHATWDHRVREILDRIGRLPTRTTAARAAAS